MRMHPRLLAAALVPFVLLVWHTAQARAIWAPVPLEVLVDESYAIVEGKVSKIEKAGFAIGNRPQDVAVIEVASVLKSLPHLKQPKQIRLLQPAAGGIAVSTDLRSTVGQTGIWLLAKHPERDGYVVKHPSQFQPSDQKENLVEMIAAREKLAGGKPIKGLQARAEVIESAVAGGPTFYEVRLSLKNVSDKPIQLLTTPFRKPLVVDWTGPAGKQLASKHYAWLKRSDPPPESPTDVVVLPPGGVAFIGPQSRDSGVYFQSPSDRPTGGDDNVAEAGRHEVVLGYVNAVEEVEGSVQELWQGKILANKISFTVE